MSETYGFIKAASVSPKFKLGSPDYNSDEIIESVRTAESLGAVLAVFPELSLTGYSCGDLFFDRSFARSALQALQKIVRFSESVNASIVVGLPLLVGSKLFNVAAFISCGKLLGLVPKTYIPNKSEFYEKRWFSSEFDRDCDIVEIGGEDIPFGADLIFRDSAKPEIALAVEICEDLWAPKQPSIDYALAGATVIVNLSAGNEYLGKSEYRRNLVRSHSAGLISAYVYSSAGPNESTSDLLFSGHLIIAENGSLLSEDKTIGFDTKIITACIDTDKLIGERLKHGSFNDCRPESTFRDIYFSLPEFNIENLDAKFNANPFVPADKSKRSESCKEIFSIQTSALARRLLQINAKSVTIGVSGGLDSALALLASVRTFDLIGLDRKGINSVTMPGFGTTDRTKTNADLLSELLGTNSMEIPIDRAVRQHFSDINHSETIRDVVYENSQARERTQILMDIANKTGGIVIGTGDLSEIALGWSTYNGDHMSMYGINSGIPKTLVKYMVEYCAESEFSGKISEVLFDICNTPVSPELLPPNPDGSIAQQTESVVGPYELHDYFLYNFVRFGFSPAKILFTAEKAFDGVYNKATIRKWLNVFITRFFTQQFKRNCMPDGIKVGSVALSPRGDWRMPSDANFKHWTEF